MGLGHIQSITVMYLPNVNQNTALVLVLLGQYGSEANLRWESSTWILTWIFLGYAYRTILLYLHYYDVLKYLQYYWYTDSYIYFNIIYQCPNATDIIQFNSMNNCPLWLENQGPPTHTHTQTPSLTSQGHSRSACLPLASYISGTRCAALLIDQLE